MLGYRDALLPSRSHATLLTILVLVLFLLSSVIICTFNSNFNNNLIAISQSSRELFSGKSESILSHRADVTSLYNPFIDDNGHHFVFNSIRAYAWLSTLVYRMPDAHRSTNKSYGELYGEFIQTFPNKDFKTISILPKNNPFINHYEHRLFYRHETQQLSTILMVSKSETRRKHCIITFLGTKSKQDLMADANLGYFNGAEIHEEFEQVAKNQFLDMTRSLKENFKMNWCDFETITINGHSLGGGLAVITGYIFLTFQPQYHKVNKTEIITFGAPRILKQTEERYRDAKWTRFVEFVEDEQSKVKMLRFEHELDVVPTLPPEKLGYFHIGTAIPLRESYWKTNCNKGWFSKNFYCHTMTHSYLPYIGAVF